MRKLSYLALAIVLVLCVLPTQAAEATDATSQATDPGVPFQVTEATDSDALPQADTVLPIELLADPTGIPAPSIMTDIYYIGHDCTAAISIVDLPHLNYVELGVTVPAGLTLERETPFTDTDEGSLTTSLIWATPSVEYWQLKWRRTVADEDGEAAIAELTFAMDDFTSRTVNVEVVECIANSYVVSNLEDTDLTFGIDGGTTILDQDYLNVPTEFHADILGLECPAVAILGAYSQDGKMLGVQTQEIIPSAALELVPGLAAVNFALSEAKTASGVTLKLMLVDAETYAPLCTPVEVGFLEISI